MERYYLRFKRGDVWFLHLSSEYGDGIKDSSVEKKSRPYLIVSNNIGNQNSPIVTVVPITTRPKDQYPMHVPFQYLADNNQAINQLVLAEQITTMSTKVFDNSKSHFMYSMSADFMRKVDSALTCVLGLTAPKVDISDIETLINQLVDQKKAEITRLKEQDLKIQVDALTEKIRKELLGNESKEIKSEAPVSLKPSCDLQPTLSLTPKATERVKEKTEKPALALTDKAVDRISQPRSTRVAEPIAIERTETGRIKWTTSLMQQFLDDYSKLSLSKMSDKWHIDKSKLASTAYRIKYNLKKNNENA